MNKKWIAPIVAVLVIVLVIWFATRGSSPSENGEEMTMSPGEYMNEDFGIAFSYPESWTVAESEYPVQDTICLNYNESTGDCSATIVISWDSDLDTRYNGLKQVYQSFDIEESTESVAGEEGRLMTITGYRSGQLGNSRELMFYKEGKVYTIGGLKGQETAFDGIVDTFVILGEESTTTEESTVRE